VAERDEAIRAGEPGEASPDDDDAHGPSLPDGRCGCRHGRGGDDWVGA
jgi:hypothetical protein